MMYRGFIKKSRTLDVAAITTVLGAAVIFLPEVKELLGDLYGVILLIIGVSHAYLRFKTEGKIGEDK